MKLISRFKDVIPEWNRKLNGLKMKMLKRDSRTFLRDVKKQYY